MSGWCCASESMELRDELLLALRNGALIEDALVRIVVHAHTELLSNPQCHAAWRLLRAALRSPPPPPHPPTQRAPSRRAS